MGRTSTRLYRSECQTDLLSSSATSTFKAFMEFIDDFLTAYLDDLLIYSENELDHEVHVKKVLTRLREAGLQIDIKKCEFHVKRTKYLGFIVGSGGIEVDHGQEKITVVKNWQEPTSVRGIQSFLGFCNFYRRFIRNYIWTSGSTPESPDQERRTLQI